MLGMPEIKRRIALGWIAFGKGDKIMIEKPQGRDEDQEEGSQ